VKAFRWLRRAEGNEIVEAGWALEVLWKLKCNRWRSLCTTSITIGAKQLAAPVSPFSQKVERSAPHWCLMIAGAKIGWEPFEARPSTRRTEQSCLNPGKASTNVGGKPSGESPLLLELVSAALWSLSAKPQSVSAKAGYLSWAPHHGNSRAAALALLLPGYISFSAPRLFRFLMSTAIFEVEIGVPCFPDPYFLDSWIPHFSVVCVVEGLVRLRWPICH